METLIYLISTCLTRRQVYNVREWDMRIPFFWDMTWSPVTTLMQCYVPVKLHPQLHCSENLHNSDGTPHV
jgi:hypothetical protein